MDVEIIILKLRFTSPLFIETISIIYSEYIHPSSHSISWCWLKLNPTAYSLVSLQVKEAAGVTLSNEEVFMATQFKDFIKTIVVVSRGGGGKKAQGIKFYRPMILVKIVFSLRKQEAVC